MQAMNGPTFATSAAPAARPPAPPRPAGPARPAAPPDADNPAARALTYLRLHWLTILFCGALLGGGLAYTAWVLLPPKYESVAMFRVAQNPASVTGGDPRTTGGREFTTYVKSAATLIQSDPVYNSALRDYGLNNVATIREQKDPYKFFDEKLIVSSKEGSEIIKLTLAGENPDDVRKIVQAITDAYMKKVVNAEKLERAAQRDAITIAKLSLEKQLRAKLGLGTEPGPVVAGVPPPAGGVVPAGGPQPPDPNALRPAGGVAVEKQPIGAPVGPTGETERMQQAKFSKLNDRAIELERGLPVLAANLKLLAEGLNGVKKELQEALDAPPPDGLAKAVREKDPDYLKAEAVAKKLARDAAHKQSEVNNPSSDGVRRAQERAEAAEVEAEKVFRKKLAEAADAARKPVADEVRTRLRQAENALKVATVKHDLDVAELAKTKKELAEIPNPPETRRELAMRDKQVNADQTALLMMDETYASLTKREIAARLDVDTPDRVTVHQQASAPMQKDTNKQILATAFAGVLGFVAVAGLMVLVEMRARKVSSLSELKASAPTAVVGVVPWQPDAATARDPAKRAEVNEAIDKLRSYVAQTWLARGATTVTVTSPLGDEGKGFTAFGLASSLAQAGYKTLLADFDLRNPALHAYAGVGNELGVCELLRGEADFRRTIQVLPNGLHFLTAGKWTDEARQAAVGGRLEALLGRLKEPFDCVVLHGHALLTAAESVEVARRSEVVLLCALYRDTRVPMLKKATERVAAMEIPFSGVVYLGATPSEALC
jgi:succinoglycan biosynthesis transport protein ExoP